MTVKHIIYTMTLATLLVAGCAEEADNSTTEGGELTLRAGFADTRGTLNDTWEIDNKVGVFSFVDATAMVSNGMYKITSVAGALAPNDGQAKIFIPRGKAVDIYAYSPYNSKVSGTTYKIDLANQSEERNVQALDLMWAKAEKQSFWREVPLTFAHKLVRLDFHLNVVGHDIDLYNGDNTITFNGANVTGDFDLKTGELKNLKAGQIKAFVKIEDSFGRKGTVTVLVAPTESLDQCQLVLKNKKGDEFIWEAKDCTAKKWMSGECYVYNFQLGKNTLIEYAEVKHGEFMMGTTDNVIDPYHRAPLHSVKLTQDFLMSKYEITVGQYAEFLNDMKMTEADVKNWNNNTLFKIGTDGFTPQFDEKLKKWYAVNDRYPMCYVSWYGAKAFAKWAGGDLPTEAQWECACRAKNSLDMNDYDRNYWGELYDETTVARYCVYNAVKPNEVGSKYPNVLDLFDMQGNVEEWCNDYFGAYIENVDDPKGPDKPALYNDDELRVYRGSSFTTLESKNITSAGRFCTGSKLMLNSLGFRIVIVK